MRYLSFEHPTHEQEYKLLYDALMTKDQGYSTADLRKLNKVLDKLEPIGKAVERGQGKNIVTSYELASSGTIALEDAEYEFIKHVLDETKWIGFHSRKVSSLTDMMDNAGKDQTSTPSA